MYLTLSVFAIFKENLSAKFMNGTILLIQQLNYNMQYQAFSAKRAILDQNH